MILAAYPIANPAFIVRDACLKVAHFVSVYLVFARRMDDGERSWMRWACDASRHWLPNHERTDHLDDWQSDLLSAVEVAGLRWTQVLGKKKARIGGVLEEITWACLARGQSCRQAMYTGGHWDSCEFFKTLEKARVFWYNPSIISDQARQNSKSSGYPETSGRTV